MVAELRRYEALLRDTFASGGRLAAAMAEAQRDQGLSVAFGHQVFGHVGSANVDVSRAIGSIAEAHRMVELLGRKLGIRADEFGPEQPKPDGFFVTAAAPVSDAA